MERKREKKKIYCFSFLSLFYWACVQLEVMMQILADKDFTLSFSETLRETDCVISLFSSCETY